MWQREEFPWSGEAVWEGYFSPTRSAELTMKPPAHRGSAPILFGGCGAEAPESQLFPHAEAVEDGLQKLFSDRLPGYLAQGGERGGEVYGDEIIGEGGLQAAQRLGQ